MDKSSVFLEVPKEAYVLETKYFFVIRDRYPVSPGHCLIISKEQKRDYFELSGEGKRELTTAINVTKKSIEKDFTPDGYNIGMNCGEVAGQTVFHFHCHLIPRYKGDMKDPRGGVRHSVEGKGQY